MKNIGKKLISSICAFAFVANSFAGVMAQDKNQDQKGDGKHIPILTGATIVDNIAIASRRQDDGEPHASGGANSGLANSARQRGDSALQFFSQERSFDNQPVVGSPFSADVVSETVQTLQDGTRIIQRFEGRIYRDSRGRTRSERTYQMGGTSARKQTINIYDAVAGASYRLDSDTGTARKDFFTKIAPPMPPQSLTIVSPSASANARALKKVKVSEVTLGKAIRKIQPHYPPIAKAANASGPVQVQIIISETGEVLDAYAAGGNPLLQEAAVQAARGWVFNPTEVSGRAVKANGLLTFNFALVDEDPPPTQAAGSSANPTANTEQLDQQVVEGVECEGERMVTTTPMGTIGNDRPIETINETWYSPELKIMILSRRSDPRLGESTYSVTNISRSEPDATLFQVPSDFNIIDGESIKQAKRIVEQVENNARKLKEELRKQAEAAQRP